MYRYFVKRVVDLFFSIILIIITLPLQLIISILLFVEIKEFPFFLQDRGITLTNQRFRIIKFRTISSDQLLQLYSKNPHKNFLQPNIQIKFTPISFWLRKMGLDELPQIYNILLGKMSFIGPRPLMLDELEIMIEKFPKENEIRNKFKSKPGLTGVWQVFGDRKLGIKNLIELDSFYEKNISFNLDFKLTFNTLLILLFVKDQDSIHHKLNFFNKYSSYLHFSNSEISNLGEITIVNKDKKLTSYKINLPAKWWYESDSYHLESYEMKIVEFPKDKSA
jgi:lipopolysaccharide/colanic/teichoic acid biosynthesis glycosyltransferase